LPDPMPPQDESRRQLLIAALAAGGFASAPAMAAALGSDGILRGAESIHQEPVFTASAKRVYEALTDAVQFERVIQLSGVMKDLKSSAPTAISAVPGGAFSLFGGYITGRQLELQPDRLIVQAWRSASWGPGLYSIAHFQIVDHGNGSMIIFDHVGFPNGQAENLAGGWQANYWVPLAKSLSA
jgi:activator of HSP90 ATPase